MDYRLQTLNCLAKRMQHTILFFCIFQSNRKNIFAKFHENLSDPLQEIEKNTENVPSHIHKLQ